MQYKEIVLKDHFPTLEHDTKLYGYILDNYEEMAPNRKRPAVVICPGGAYAYTSDREAEAIAVAFMARGYQAFVLRYSVAPVRYPHSLLELASSVALLRKFSDEFHVLPDAISVIGFSAGGHLAASLATMWHEPVVSESLGIDSKCAKPNALLLSYPVITGGEFAHRGSFDNLLGEDASDELRKEFSLETRVSEKTPPSFIWHTLQDACVPVENSMLFASALQKYKVPFEMHLFPYGHHGISLASPEVPSMNDPDVRNHLSIWFELCDRWLKTMFSICDNKQN